MPERISATMHKGDGSHTSSLEEMTNEFMQFCSDLPGDNSLGQPNDIDILKGGSMLLE